MAIKGSAIRAEGNQSLRARCASCGKSISTEVGHAHPLDEKVRRETWGLLGRHAGKPKIFPTCAACYAAGWRPPNFGEVIARSRRAARVPNQPFRRATSSPGTKGS